MTSPGQQGPAVPSRRRLPTATTACAVAAVVAVTFAPGFFQRAAATVAPRLVASDAMNRQVSAGFGTADRGGAYQVSSSRLTRVRNGAGELGPVGPGQSAFATLPAISTRDVGIRASVRLHPAPQPGNGLYLYVLLRRQPDGSAYFATLRDLPNGTVGLALSRHSSGTATVLGRQITVPGASGSDSLTLDAEVTGTDPVTVRLRAWAAGTAQPTGWQEQYVDSAGARLATAGQVGFMAYSSGSATGTAAADVQEFTAWDGGLPANPAAPQPTPAPTPGPTANPRAGAAPLGSASYSVPANAVFVSPTGADSAAGTQAAPLRTLARAIQVAPSGATVVLRAGTYHESVTVPSNKTLTIEGYPGEAAWLDGSSPVSSWASSGTQWIHDGWTAQFDSTPSYTSTVPTGPNWSFVNPAYPMAAHPDQAWLDGTALAQVGSASAVKPGSFYVDYSTDRLYVGTDPTGHQLRASDLGVALTVNSPNSTLRGFGVRRYATAVRDMGAIRMRGTGDVVDNLVSSQNATTGIAVLAANVHVTHVTLNRNGMLGMHGGYADNLVVDGLLSENNNAEHFNYAPVSGGAKISRSRGLTVRNSVFRHNLGPGLWFDQSCYDAVVSGTTFADNAGNGMSFEISSTAIFVDNVVSNNGALGFKINDSDHVQVWSNTFSDNARNVEVVQDSRRGTDLSVPGHDPRRPQPDPTEPWIIFNDSVMNNVFAPASGSACELYVNDNSGQYSATALGTVVDGNMFVRPTSGSEITWGVGGNRLQQYNATATFDSGTGVGAQNTEVVGQTSLPTATQLQQADPLVLPDDVATVAGVPAGSRYIGAF